MQNNLKAIRKKRTSMTQEAAAAGPQGQSWSNTGRGRWRLRPAALPAHRLGHPHVPARVIDVFLRQVVDDVVIAVEVELRDPGRARLPHLANRFQHGPVLRGLREPRSIADRWRFPRPAGHRGEGEADSEDRYRHRRGPDDVARHLPPMQSRTSFLFMFEMMV